MRVDNDSNISLAEEISMAAVRDMLAEQRAELERERRLREELEQKSAALTRQLHEQQVQMSSRDASVRSQPSCGGHSCGMPRPELPTDHSGEMTPSAPLLHPADNAAASSSMGSPILPDRIPIIIATSPGPSSHFHHCYTAPIDLQHSVSASSSPDHPISVGYQSTPSLPHPETLEHGSCARAAVDPTDASGWNDDITMYQRHLEAQALEAAGREAEDEQLAMRLQAEAAREAEVLQKRQSDLDAEMAAKMMADEQQVHQERSDSDAKMAAEAWAAEQERAEEARLREQQDLEAAQRAQEEEEERMQEELAAREAQAAENERVAQLLDAVSKRTQQDIDDLDRAAVVADHDGEPLFECPVLYVECNKMEEGECVGQWSKCMCNHWISRDALAQYICSEAEEQRFRMRCPVCCGARCKRCTQHRVNPRDEGWCYIPPRQIRAVLSEEQMARLLYLQEQYYRTANRDRIVQCPHPDCQFFYALDAEDADQGDPDEEGEQSRWQEGRDMWCDTCEVRYCLHCGDRMGTLVKWHTGKTCAEFLQDTENAAAAAERRRLEALANEGHEQNRGKTWQRCPRCGYEAWKADGQCNRVVCKEHCAANFCFLCGEDITKQRYHHYEDATRPCHNKVWHMPAAGVAGKPACRCNSCRKR